MSWKQLNFLEHLNKCQLGVIQQGQEQQEQFVTRQLKRSCDFQHFTSAHTKLDE